MKNLFLGLLAASFLSSQAYAGVDEGFGVRWEQISEDEGILHVHNFFRLPPPESGWPSSAINDSAIHTVITEWGDITIRYDSTVNSLCPEDCPDIITILELPPGFVTEHEEYHTDEKHTEEIRVFRFMGV